jgi:hypothetical protein
MLGHNGLRRSESAFGVIALVPAALGLIVVAAVILQGGLNGNHIRLLTFQGASWPSVCAGVAIAVPFFFGADFSVTQSSELGEEAQRWSRSNVIWLVAFVALLQYCGAIGTAVAWPDIPAFSPLASTYVGGSIRGFAWFLVIASGAIYAILLSVLFSRRLAGLGLRLPIRVGVVAVLPAAAIGMAVVTTSDGVHAANWSWGMESIFLNASSVGGALLVVGLGAGCVRAILKTRSLKMGAMEYAPALVGLLGLGVAFYGYFWRGVTSAPMARMEFAVIVGTVLIAAALLSWRNAERFSEEAQ